MVQLGDQHLALTGAHRPALRCRLRDDRLDLGPGNLGGTAAGRRDHLRLARDQLHRDLAPSPSADCSSRRRP